MPDKTAAGRAAHRCSISEPGSGEWLKGTRYPGFYSRIWSDLRAKKEKKGEKSQNNISIVYP